MVWRSIGPTPQLATRFFALNYRAIIFAGTVSGRTEALVFSEDIRPRDQIPALFNGSASGGVWRSTDITGRHANEPSWDLVSPEPGGVQNLAGIAISVPNQRGINRIGALAETFRQPNRSVVYAGTG